MVFFDLNIPYLERGGSAAATPSEAAMAAAKAGRLKVAVKAMELGYTGVAYNRTIRGVVSDANCCMILPLPLSSLLKAAPALAAAAKFHRELLGVPVSSPFRQYTRLTVAVDSALGAAALQPGNAVLRTYHLVAVRPLNQAVFDQACKVSEVDLIAIDLSQKLPFRLKLAMVQAAIKRGVYFEVTYSHLVSDIHTRRQMLSNAKLLIDWTRGKNLIFSSGTSNVNEVRGPYDVINLSSLLGLSMEKAKLAISRNCRSLLNNALRRKQCYKEAIRIEKISPSQCLDTKESWFVEWGKWDPISSGEGDLPGLDDIARFLSGSGQASKSYSEINFESASDGQFDGISSSGGDLVSLDDRESLFPVTVESEPSIAANEAPYQDKREVLIEDGILLPATPLEHQLPDDEGDLVLPPDFGKLFPSDENFEPLVTENEGPSLANKFGVACAADEEPQSGNLSNVCNPAEKFELMSLGNTDKLFTVPETLVPSGVCASDIKSLVGHDYVSVVLDTPVDATPRRDLISGIKNGVSPKDDERPLINLMEIDPLFSIKVSGSLGELVSSHDMPEVQVLARAEKLEKEDPFTSAYDIHSEKDFARSGVTGEDDRVPFPDGTRFNDPSDMKVLNQRDTTSLADGIPSNDATDILVNMEQYGEVSAAAIGSQKRKLKLGKVKFKRKPSHRGLPLLSRHFMHHQPFKKVVHSKGSRENLVRMKHDNFF